MDRERTDRGPETLPFRSPMPRSDHVLSDVISSRFRGLLRSSANGQPEFALLYWWAA
jgi:hypothetical protein